MNTVRKPAVAGQFYPGEKAALERALSRLTDRNGKRDEVIAAMSPHAGYIYSGAVAGKVLSLVMPKELFVIIGPNHTGFGKQFSVFAKGAWKTPLGTVQIDGDFTQRLIGASSLFESDAEAHAAEHSLEVQIPFLQYLMKDFKIAPICVGSLDLPALRQAGEEIAAAIKSLGRNAVIIASSDMTHYEPHESAKEKDMRALSAIVHLREDELFETVSSLHISMCGAAPVIIALTASKAIGAAKAALVDYQTSAAASGDYSSVVGYGGVVIT